MRTAIKAALGTVLGEAGYHWLRYAIHRVVVTSRRVAHGRPRAAFHGLAPEAAALREFTEADAEVWFGYYDVTPFSAGEQRLLAMRYPTRAAARPAGQEIAVGCYRLDHPGSGFIEVGRTETWCWQQGCRLQWVPGEPDRQIIYNRLVEGGYGAVVQDIETNAILRAYRRPVYALSPDGRWGISLDFSRLHRLRRGYGYAALPDRSAGERRPVADGLWRIDMATGAEEFLFSVAEIAALEPLPSMAGAEHYFNHVQFNPDSSRFMFFHLWLDGGRRYSRLVTCDIEGKDRFALVNEGHVSHYCWRSPDVLLAYSTHAASGERYHLYRDRHGVIGVVGEGVLVSDGHPSYGPVGGLILTDTYPDRLQERRLMVFDSNSGTLESLGSYYSPFKMRGEIRCDLHPRWSPSGRCIAFDSAHDGRRKIYVIDRGAEAAGIAKSP